MLEVKDMYSNTRGQNYVQCIVILEVKTMYNIAVHLTDPREARVRVRPLSSHFLITVNARSEVLVHNLNPLHSR